MTLRGISIIRHSETPGLGAKITENEYLDQYIGLDIDDVELKYDGGQIDAITGATISSEAVADAVVQVLRKTKIAGNALILSFDWRALSHAEKIAPEIPTVYLSHVGVRLNNIKPGQSGPSPWMAGIDVDDFKGSIPRAVNAAGGRYWAPHYKYITSGLLKEAHRLGLKVFVWTPDSRNDMQRLIQMGVDGIITNRPDILVGVLSGSP